MNQVKGSVLVSRMKYIDQFAQPDQKEQLIASLSPETRSHVTEQLLTGKWYPIQTLHDLHNGADRFIGKGDKQLLVEIGRFSAEDALTGIYKLFFKVGSPEFIIKRATNVWKQFYSSGDMSTEIAETGKGKVVLRNVDDLKQEHCLVLKGWMQRVLELSGAKNVRMEIVKSGNNCDFNGLWS